MIRLPLKETFRVVLGQRNESCICFVSRREANSSFEAQTSMASEYLICPQQEHHLLDVDPSPAGGGQGAR